MFVGRLNQGFRGSFVLMLFLFGIVLFLSFFIAKPGESNNFPNIFYNYLIGRIEPSIFRLLMNHLCIIFGCTLVGYIISNEEITEKQNYFPVFIYFMISSMALAKNQVSIYLLSNIIILFSLYKLFNTYRKENVLREIFTACFLLGFSFYLNIGNILIVPFLFVTMALFRPFYWREFVIAIIGFICPVYLYESVSYLLNFNQWYLFESAEELFRNFRQPVLKQNYIPFLSIIISLFVISILSFFIKGLGNTVKKQKAKTAFFWYMLLMSPLIFLYGVSYANMIIIFAIPFSFLIGEFLYELKSTRFANLLCILIFLSGIYFMIYKCGWLDAWISYD